MCSKTGELWDKFVIWARNHGIEFRALDDYELLWRCWYDCAKTISASHKDEKIEVE